MKTTLVTLLATTLLGFSQETPSDTPTVGTVNLPAERTLTSADGRQMAGTVLAKSDTGIKFRRTSDAKEFDIPLDKLSEDDRKWVDATKPAPIAKALVVFGTPMSEAEFRKMEALGMEVTLGILNGRSWGKLPEGSTLKEKDFSEVDIKNYDILWLPESFIDKKTYLEFVHKCDSANKVLVLDRVEQRPSKRVVYEDKLGRSTKIASENQTKVEKNFIFYRMPGKHSDHFLEELIELSLEVFKKQK